MKPVLNGNILKAIQINQLAYEIELKNPKLSFFDLNKLVIKGISEKKLKLIVGGGK